MFQITYSKLKFQINIKTGQIRETEFMVGDIYAYLIRLFYIKNILINS